MPDAPIIVLGHFPAYLELAKNLAARAFMVDRAVYEGMSDDERWAANTMFVDRAIADGCTIVLSTAPSRVRTGSVFERELAYLASQGWRPDFRDGRWEMIR